MSELLFVLRQLRQAPAHIAAVIVSLGIGMAVCGAVFSAVNTLLSAALPGIGDRHNLVHIRWVAGSGLLTHREFEAIEHETRPVLRSVGAQAERIVSAALPAGAARVRAAFVSSRFFETLGTVPVRGRLLTTSDARLGAWPVVVISEDLWHRSYGSDPQTIGRAVAIGDRAFTIVGIVPERFAGLRLFELGGGDGDLPHLWLPLVGDVPDLPWLAVGGRLAAPADLEAARNLLAVLAARVASTSRVQRDPAVLRAFRASLDWRTNPRDALLSMGVFLMVPLALLAIGCANVINLQLARATDRAQELRVRRTLGASRLRIIRLLTIEIGLLTLLAGGVGWFGARLLLIQVEPVLPFSVALDGGVVLLLLLLVSAVIAVTGLAPAWLASRDTLGAGLKSVAGSLPHKRLRASIVVVQVGGSLALLFITVLGVRTLQLAAPSMPPDAEHILVAHFDLSEMRPSDPRSAAFLHDVLAELDGRTAVRAAGFSSFFRVGQPIRYWLRGDRAEIVRMSYGGPVTDRWFDAIGARLLAGRGFDAPGSMLEVVINNTLAIALGGHATALESPLRILRADGHIELVTIAGVVEDQVTADVPTMFLRMPHEPPGSLVLAVHAASPDGAVTAIRSAVSGADPLVSHNRIVSLEQRIAEMFTGFRELVWVGGAMAALALLLAAAGLFALLAFTVRRRTHEIGIRVALGATRWTVVTMVFRQGFGLALVGCVSGLALAVPLAYVMQSAFVGVSPMDPGAVLPTLGVLMCVSATASVVPAWRALRIEPAVALRED